jgi:hypothetical protein
MAAYEVVWTERVTRRVVVEAPDASEAEYLAMSTTPIVWSKGSTVAVETDNASIRVSTVRKGV